VKADESNIKQCLDTLIELAKTPTANKVRAWGKTNRPTSDDYMTTIQTVGGKGRFAQRLALKDVQPPEYVANALRYLERQ
jgi:putative ATP-dependent endonuclease of the OLD family